MLRRRHLLATSAAGLAPWGDATAATPKDMVVFGMAIADAISLDPAECFEFSGAEVSNNIYERLVRPNAVDPSKLDGVLAASWSEAGGKSFTFKLHADHKFSSGKPVTAEDAAFSFRRAVILNKSPAPILTQFGFNKDNVQARIRATDATTLVFDLPEAVAPSFFINCLSANVGGIVEMAVAMANQKNGDLGNEWLKTNSAGSGPFMLRSWKPSEQFALDANPHAHTQPKIRRVLLRHMPEAGAQRLALTNGDIDIARGLPVELIESLAADPAYRVDKVPRASELLLALSQKFEPWKRVEVRQAVKFAIDYDGIQRNILKDSYIVHQTNQPVGFPGAWTERLFSRRVDHARALMKQANMEGGFEVTLDHSNAYPFPDIAQAIQANLKDIGIRVNVLSQEGRQALTKLRARNSEMYMGRWAGDYFDPHTNADWFLSNPDNSDAGTAKKFAWRISWDPGPFNARVDAATREVDTGKRLKMYIDMQKDEAQVSPFVYMFQEVQLVARRANVTGLQLGLLYDATRYDMLSKS